MNARISADVFYVNGVPIPASYFVALDTAQYQAVWGDAGGTWDPTSLISVSGAGVWVYAPVTLNSTVSSVFFLGGSSQLTHGDSDYVTFNPQLSHQFTQSIGQSGIDASYGTMGYLGFQTPYVPRFQWNYPNDSLISWTADSSYTFGGRLVIPLDVHHGATLSTVLVYFIVAPHSFVPASLPMLRIFQVDVSGNVTQLATNTALTGWAGGGFVTFTPTPTTGAGWYASGAAHFIQWTADAGVVIDTTQYRYFAEVVDEQGANALAGNLYLSLRPLYIDIADVRPQ